MTIEARVKQDAKPVAESHDYVVTADGWVAGQRRGKGDVVRLSEPAARYETRLERKVAAPAKRKARDEG